MGPELATITLDVSYGQIAVFGSTLASPLNDWTDEDFARGFAWRPGSVSFRTLEHSGPHTVSVLLVERHDQEGAARTMNGSAKRVEDLRKVDVERFPVWQYVNSDESGETIVRPVKRTPVANLNGRLVGTKVRLANGSKVWALIGLEDAWSARPCGVSATATGRRVPDRLRHPQT